MSERVDGIFSIDKFYEFLENKRRLRENYLDIKVSSKDLIPLFNIQGDQAYVINLTSRHEDKKGIRRQANSSEKYINRIYVAGMASCIVNYRISITSNALGGEYEEYKTILDVEDFKSWFTKISFNRVLIPDTNALMNRSLSSLCFVLGNDYLQNLTILIPRLSVLEMERIATQDGGQDKEKYNEQKRKVMSTVAELFFLKRNKGQFLPELDDRTFMDFSQIAGEHFTDAWIRRKEIRRYIKEITYGVEVKKTKKVTLVTSDLINALSATAEGIDVIYFSKTGSDNILPRSHVLDQIVRFIILCAILFEEIKISINNEDLSIKGIWEGKTPSEWITDSVMITR